MQDKHHLMHITINWHIGPKLSSYVKCSKILCMKQIAENHSQINQIIITFSHFVGQASKCNRAPIIIANIFQSDNEAFKIK